MGGTVLCLFFYGLAGAVLMGAGRFQMKSGAPALLWGHRRLRRRYLFPEGEALPNSD